jgi:hypothetical protein
MVKLLRFTCRFQVLLRDPEPDYGCAVTDIVGGDRRHQADEDSVLSIDGRPEGGLRGFFAPRRLSKEIEFPGGVETQLPIPIIASRGRRRPVERLRLAQILGRAADPDRRQVA